MMLLVTNLLLVVGQDFLNQSRCQSLSNIVSRHEELVMCLQVPGDIMTPRETLSSIYHQQLDKETQSSLPTTTIWKYKPKKTF